MAYSRGPSLVFARISLVRWLFCNKFGMKYHNYILQTNLRHHKEEPHNEQETLGRQTNQSNQLSLPHQDDCKTKMDKK